MVSRTLFLVFLSLFSFITSPVFLYSETINDKIDFRAFYPNFDLSLNRYGLSKKSFERHFFGKTRNEELCIHKLQVEKLYEKRRKEPLKLQTHKIPHVIHQIWLGSPVPEKYQELMKGWQNWEGWTYILWTDEEVKSLTLRNQNLYDKAPNYGEKADILRYELLEQFGGIYVDIDFENIKPDFFEWAHDAYAFYLGIEPLECATFSCCNAIMASSPHHPVIQKIVSKLAVSVKKNSHANTVFRTGPRYLSHLIYSSIDLLAQHDGIIFPPTFFYPMVKTEILSTKNRDVYFHPETVALHYWAGSWRPQATSKSRH